jgi:hypothetical protein
MELEQGIAVGYHRCLDTGQARERIDASHCSSPGWLDRPGLVGNDRPDRTRGLPIDGASDDISTSPDMRIRR